MLDMVRHFPCHRRN